MGKGWDDPIEHRTVPSCNGLERCRIGFKELHESLLVGQAGIVGVDAHVR